MISLASATPRKTPSTAKPPAGISRTARNHSPHILVTDCGRGSAVAMIRSFRRRGWSAIAGDSVPHNLRFRSCAAAQQLLYPSPQSAPAEFVDAVLDAVHRWNIDLVVPITDEALLPLSQSRARFPESCQLAIPDASALELTTNKQKTLDLAGRLGVPVPKTAIVSTVADACRQAEAFHWPIVLKPLVSRLYRDGQPIETLTVTYADSVSTLQTQMKKFEGRCAVLLQEYVCGVGYGVEMLAHAGRPLAAFQHKRLREVPITGGASSLRESVPLDPTLYEYALRLLRALNWTGLAMVEFKVGEDGPRLMEINGRVWGSLPLAVHSGVDFPVGLAELYLDGPPASDQAPQTQYRVGIRGRNLELDIVWMIAVLTGRRRYSYLPMPSRSAGLSALLGLLNPSIRFDILSLRDPLPGLAELLRIARKLVKKGRNPFHSDTP